MPLSGFSWPFAVSGTLKPTVSTAPVQSAILSSAIGTNSTNSPTYAPTPVSLPTMVSASQYGNSTTRSQFISAVQPPETRVVPPSSTVMETTAISKPSAVTPSAKDTSSASDSPRTTHVQVTKTFTETVAPGTTTSPSQDDSTVDPSPITATRRTTTLKVTQTITNTISTDVTSAAVGMDPLKYSPSARPDGKRTTHVKVTSTTTMYVPNATDIIKKSSVHTGLPTAFTPTQSADTSKPTNNLVIAASVIGSIFGLAFIVLLIWVYTRRQRKYSKERSKRSCRNRQSNNIILEVKRRNLRYRRDNVGLLRYSQGLDPVALANAQDWQTDFGNGNFQNASQGGSNNFARPVAAKLSSSLTAVEIAQAQSWATGPFGRREFQKSSSNLDGKQTSKDLSMRKPLPYPNAPSEMGVGYRQGSRPRKLGGGHPFVSPLSSPIEMRDDYSDVSPSDSPIIGIFRA